MRTDPRPLVGDEERVHHAGLPLPVPRLEYRALAA